MSDETIRLKKGIRFDEEKLFMLLFVIFMVAVFLFNASERYGSAIWAAIACCNSVILLFRAKYKKQIRLLNQQLRLLKQQIPEQG